LITRDAPPEVRGHGMEPGGWGKLLRDPSLWCLGVYYLAGSFGWSFFVSWMPRYFSEGLGVPFTKSEWFMTGPLFFGGLSCLLGGAISHYHVQRTGRKRLFRAIFPVMGATSAAIAIFSMQYVKSPVVATVLLCVVASAFDFGQAANWASIVDLGGKYAGSAAGFINMVGNIGQAFQPFIGAMIFTAFGWSTLFVVYAIAYIVAASMWLFIDPTRTFYERGPKAPAYEAFPVAEPA
jgi:nitrate/nitrite transporter NarK